MQDYSEIPDFARRPLWSYCQLLAAMGADAAAPNAPTTVLATDKLFDMAVLAKHPIMWLI